jgi:hypothetical protein
MMSRIGQCIVWISGLLGFAVLPMQAACAQDKTSYMVVTELPQWMPGKPDKSTQYVFWDGGRGQLSEIVQGKAVRVSDFSYGTQGKPSLIVDEVFSMDANYGAPKVAGLIVEGRANKTMVVAHDGARTKFVTAERELLPQPITDLLKQVTASALSRTGEFVSVRSLPDSFVADLVKAGTVPTLSLDLLQKFPELQEALRTPFKLVDFSAARWEQLRVGLNLKSPPFHVQLGDGAFARIEFFQ